MYRKPEEIILTDGRTLADVYAAHQRWLLGDRRWDDPDRARLDGARLDGARLDGARLDGASLDRASLDGARLDGARLDGASLDRASLDGASLDGASLDGARLDGARLVGASLVGARLVGASLVGARLVGARLVGARLVGASLDGASLESADLSRIAADVRALADEYATAEVQGLIRALHMGRVNGTCYEPQCGMACLVGTIAMVRGVSVHTLRTDSSRPAEAWALAIRPGDSAPGNQIATLTAKWLTAALVERPDYDAAHPFGDTGMDTPLARNSHVIIPRDMTEMVADPDRADAYALELMTAALAARGGV